MVQHRRGDSIFIVIVNDLFYGEQKSTVMCEVCGEEFITVEPFSSLSLPLPSEQKCKLQDCLTLYLAEEEISGWNCPSCKVARSAIKKFDITRLPPILVVHLKRFMADGVRGNLDTFSEILKPFL